MILCASRQLKKASRAAQHLSLSRREGASKEPSAEVLGVGDMGEGDENQGIVFGVVLLKGSCC